MKRSAKTSLRPDLSIVIPALNEAHRIQKTLTQLVDYLGTNQTMKSIKVEVVIVSADSHDKTHQIIEHNREKFKDFQFVKPGKKLGKGRDVKAGMLAARGKVRIFMDADLATPLEYLDIFYKSYEISKADVIVGVRNLKKHHPERIRRFVSQSGNLLFRIFGGVWISDSQCGFKLFTDQTAELCFNKMTIFGWGFDMELLSIAKINNLEIKSIAIDDWESVEGGAITHARIIDTSLLTLRDLGIIFLNRLRGKYYVGH